MQLKLLKKFSAKRKKHIPFPVYLSYCLIIVLLLTSVTSAKYLSSMSGSNNADVAKWVVDVEYDDTKEFTMEQSESNQFRNYDFCVKNYKNDKISEVAIQYDIIIVLNQELQSGVEMKLYDNKNKELVFENISNNQYIYKNVNHFDAGSETSHNYYIEFFGDFNQISNNETYDITIRVDAQQID